MRRAPAASPSGEPNGEPAWICFGNEPSWSVDLTQPGVARLTEPSTAAVVYRGGTTRNDPMRESVWRGAPDGDSDGDLVLLLAETGCSEGMSDVTHPVKARLSLPDGRFLVGWCRDASRPSGEGRAQSVTTIEGVEWQVTGYDDGRGGGASPIEGTRLTLSFGDGALTEDSGCNTFRGAYTMDGEILGILRPLVSTRRMCIEPPGVMEQQRAFLAALQGAKRWTLRGDQLELRLAGGERAVTARRRPGR